MPTSATKLAHAVAQFSEGSRLHATGLFLRNNDVVTAGLDQIEAALAVIDAESPDGRGILIPFLDHSDAMVRCEAAQALHRTHRDLVIPILQDISLTCVTEACETASLFLIFAGEPNKDSHLMSRMHPHKYDDKAYREALDRI